MNRKNKQILLYVNKFMPVIFAFIRSCANYFEMLQAGRLTLYEENHSEQTSWDKLGRIPQ